MADIIVDTTDTIPAVANLDNVYFVKGGTNVTAGLDLSALLEGVTNIYVARDWTGNIGSSSTSLKTDVDGAATSVFRYGAGGGACWYTPNGDNNLATLVRNVGKGTLTVNGTGTLTTFEAGNGQTILGGNITATTIRIGGEGKVDLQSTSGTAPTTVEITGGFFKTARGATTLSIYGGAAVVEAATNAITTINYAGGNLFLAQSGTITTLNILAGNASSIRVGRPLTITNTVIWSTVFGASAFLDNPFITFSNAATWRIDQGNQP